MKEKRNNTVQKIMVVAMVVGLTGMITFSVWASTLTQETLRPAQVERARDGAGHRMIDDIRDALVTEQSGAPLATAAKDGSEKALLTFKELALRLTLKVSSDYEPAEVIYEGLQGPTPNGQAVEVKVISRPQEGSKPPVIKVSVYADETQTTPKEVLAALITRAESAEEIGIPHYIGSQFKIVAAQYAPELLGRSKNVDTARDGGDRVSEINARLREIKREEETLAPQKEEPEVRAQLDALQSERIGLMTERYEITGSAGDGGVRALTPQETIARLQHTLELLRTSRDLQEKPADITLAEQEITKTEKEIAVLEIFPNLGEPLSNIVIKRARAKEVGPAVLGYDIAEFYRRPASWVDIWQHKRQDNVFGNPGEGIVTVLLPYAVHEGETALVGIDPENMAKVFKTLNDFVEAQTGVKVDLKPEDFGVRVPARLLNDVDATNAYIQDQTGGYPLTTIFARKEIADVFLGKLKTLIAFVFDLPKDNELGGEVLNKALLTSIKDGQRFVIPSMNVSDQAASALRIVRDTLTKF